MYTDTIALFSNFCRVSLTAIHVPAQTLWCHVLPVKVITAEDLQRQKEEAELRKKKPKDPYESAERLNKLVEDVATFEKVVDSLTQPSPAGASPLDKQWKVLMTHIWL